MVIEEQIKIAKGAVLGLLTRAYQKRYRVGVVIFRDVKAEVILPPTTSITRARQALQAVAAGGGTPLASGLQTVLRMVRSERIRHPNDLPQMILITDGNPSVTLKTGAVISKEGFINCRTLSGKEHPFNCSLNIRLRDTYKRDSRQS